MGGGTRRHVLDLLPALARAGHEVTLAVSPRRNWPERETFARDVAFLQAHGVKVHCIEMPRGLVGGGAAVRALAALIRREKPDVVHCHSTVAGAMSRLARLASPRTPLVYTPHCIAFATGLPRLQRRAARWIELLLSPLATRYIAVSHAERRAIARLLHRRSTVVHNGIDIEGFDAVLPQQRAGWNLAETDFVIGCFGRLCAQKNQLAAIHALAAVTAQLPAAKLLLVGDGEDRAMLETEISALNLGSKVIFAGEHAEARGFYTLCDVVVQPSRWEGCPYTVLEAMAARKPIVAHAVGGVPELVDSTCGVAYRGRDDLTTVLLKAATDIANHRAIGNAARTRVECRFALQQMVDKTLAVYHASV